jgi:hypothetical protein
LSAVGPAIPNIAMRGGIMGGREHELTVSESGKGVKWPSE